MPSSDTWWKPGKSGNPSGKPKGALSLTTQLKRALAFRDEQGKATSEKIVDILVGVALAGDVKALTYVFDRIDGKVPDAPAELGDRTTRVEIAVIGQDSPARSTPEAT